MKRPKSSARLTVVESVAMTAGVALFGGLIAHCASFVHQWLAGRPVSLSGLIGTLALWCIIPAAIIATCVAVESRRSGS